MRVKNIFLMMSVFLIVSIVSSIKNDLLAGHRSKDEEGYSFSSLVRKYLGCFVRKDTFEDEEENFLLDQEGLLLSYEPLEARILENIPTEMLWEICSKLQPLDIIRLSLTSKNYRRKINEKFWKRYIKLHKQKRWDQNIPFVKVAYAFSLFTENKIEQAARLGLPKAIKIIGEKENENEEKKWGKNPCLSSHSPSFSYEYEKNKYTNPFHLKIGNGFRGF